MVITGAQIGTTFLLAAIICMALINLKQHERLSLLRRRATEAETKVLLLEVENLQLRNLNTFRDKYDTPRKEESYGQDGATYELCKKTGGWRIT